MFRSVFRKTLYDQRRAFLGWSVGVALLVGLMAAIWPSVRDMPNLDEFVANYPEAMRELPIALQIVRGGKQIFAGETSTAQMKRTFEEARPLLLGALPPETRRA